MVYHEGRRLSQGCGVRCDPYPPSVLSLTACSQEVAERLASSLGISRITAEVLARRGFADPAEARAFLDLEGPLHDPLALGAMTEACEAIEDAIATRRRIVVHGDYDVDGVCATALAVETLRELGADVGWHLPSRFVEGYGVAVETIDLLADQGAGLILCVDCGLSAAEAVAHAQARGLSVVICDHHRPGPVLPEAPLVCARGPHEGSYPFGELCGAGVVFKLAQALWARRLGTTEPPVELQRGLDLVALATIADVVELRDENRALVRAGLRRLARGERPGLAALMDVAGVDRARLRSSDLGFRLGPRINAAGRLGHPREALDLMLARDRAEAEPLAQRLEERNRERQSIEAEIVRAAVATIEARPPERRDVRGYVVAGEGWHAGVIGIVASRLVERYGRPVVVIALDGDRGTGSGRSVPAFDLHAGLGACASLLERFGGHRAAAGLTIEAGQVAAFTEAFEAHVGDVLGESDLEKRVHVDAIAGVGELSLALAQELARLEPHGIGNPAPRILVPAAQLDSVETMGDGKHLRMQIASEGARCGAVAFGKGDALDALRAAGVVDVVCRLEAHSFRGALSQRLSLVDLREVADHACDHGCAGAPRLARGADVVPLATVLDEGPRVRDVRESGGLALAATLAASGESLCVVVNDLAPRCRELAAALDVTRFAGATPVLVPWRIAADERDDRVLQAVRAGVALVEHRAFARLAGLRSAFAHVLVLEPPLHAEESAALRALPSGTTMHLAYGARDLAAARAVAEREALRPLMAALWRAGAPGEKIAAGALVAAADWTSAGIVPPPTGEAAGEAIDALVELGLAERDGEVLRLSAPAGKSDPSASPTFARVDARRRDALERIARAGAHRTRVPAAGTM
jgi:single-stranded-DNA-specific exonuclease